MHSALRPYVTTGLAIVGSSVLALAPIAPPAPADGATTTNQSSQPVTLTAKVITINPSPDSVDINESLQGRYCNEASGNTCVALEYLPIWTTQGQFGFGVEALRQELAAAAMSGEDITVFGFSEGAVVASQWLDAYLRNPEAYPAPENLTFVVIGNPSNKYTGSGGIWGTVWPDSDFRVIDVMNQYDPTVDMPLNTLNTLAVLNATMGFFTNHLGDGYTNVDLDDPNNVTWEDDGIEYVFVPATSLPLVEPLRWLGMDELADELTGPLQYLIEQAYFRDDHIGDLPPLSTADSIFYAPINILEAIGNIPYYAVQGTNRFAESMRASGSWWKYSDVNVLGWDPANPEMTRAFVDFLISVPAISEPLGEIADYWARANLPMNVGCTGTGQGQCDNPNGLTNQMFKVMLWDLFSKDGFTFTDPITPQYNPVSENETYWGQELGETGEPVEWYGETVYLDPYSQVDTLWDFLVSPPEGLKYPTIADQFNAAKNLFEALMVTWYPFVPQSQIWNPAETQLAYALRPFAKILCPDCNKVDPFMPTAWEVGDDIPKGAYIPPSVRDVYDEDGNYIGDEAESAAVDDASPALLAASVTEEETAEAPAEEAAEEQPDVIADAVQGLKDKFETVGEQDVVTDETPVDDVDDVDDAEDTEDTDTIEEVDDTADSEEVDEVDEVEDTEDTDELADLDDTEGEDADEAGSDSEDTSDSDSDDSDSDDSDSDKSDGSDSSSSGSSGSDSGDSGSDKSGGSDD